VELFVNDARVEDFRCEAATLGDAIRQVQDACCPAGHIVVAFRCDGLEIPAHEMDAQLQRPAAEFKRLEVLTGTQSQLVRDAMTQAHEALDATAEELGSIADQITAGQIVEGVESLARSLNVWQQVHEAIAKSIQMLRLDPEGMEVEGESLVHAIRRPKDMLLQIKDALVAKDYVLLSDVLHYEFEQTIGTWRAIIGEIQRLAIEQESRVVDAL
jgi:hypothetical protein